MRDIRSENLSTVLIVNELYYFPGHDIISGQENALGRFHLIFLTDTLSLKLQSGSKQKERVAVFYLR